MKIAIVGGILQGMELTYLARKAKYESVVVDRDPSAPAASFADSFVQCDVVSEPEKAREIFADCDAVIPAMEEADALASLDSILGGMNVPFLFDLRSYGISSSKIESNKVMARDGIPLPRPWPECGFPAIVKPSSQSGSVGVSVARNDAELERGLRKVEKLGDEPVVQEFVSGKSVSVEVIGDGTSSRSYVTTEVVLDSNYDCKQVVCEPGILPPAEDGAFGMMAETIADAMHLNGLMDLEAIYTDRGLRVLEIDARFPSQTPAAVLAGTGVNLLEEFVKSRCGGTPATPSPGCSIYEHFTVSDGIIRTCGEKEFAHVDRPYVDKDFFGADEAITDYGRNANVWRATIINKGRTMQECLHKRREFITSVMKDCDLDEFIDKSPEMM